MTTGQLIQEIDRLQREIDSATSASKRNKLFHLMEKQAGELAYRQYIEQPDARVLPIKLK